MRDTRGKIEYTKGVYRFTSTIVILLKTGKTEGVFNTKGEKSQNWLQFCSSPFNTFIK